jgi:SAM-dependent methyltransferase
MPIIKTSNHVEEYAARARYFPPAEMTGRGSQTLTLTVSQNLLGYMGAVPDGTILDVGCGDGTLISLLKGDRIGVSPSTEEIEQLRSLWPNVSFEVALAQTLPLRDASISVLVCNGVLLALETEEEVCKALAEFARVCRANAAVFLGEIPVEPVRSQYRHDSVPIWLWTLLTRSGPKNFLAGVRDVARATFTDTPLLFYPERWFYCPREKFISLAGEYGLCLTRDRVTPHISTRRDYLFHRAK